MICLTLNEIRKHGPCKSGWGTLLKAQGKTEADDEAIALADIIESNGIEDAIWCFRINWLEHKELYLEFISACVERAESYSAEADADASAAALAASAAYAAAKTNTKAATCATTPAASIAYAAEAANCADYAAGQAAKAANTYAAYLAEKAKQKEHLLQLLQNHS